MKTSPLVAMICLYGNLEIGFGYIGQLESRVMVGDGKPTKFMSKPGAIVSCLYALRTAGLPLRGIVRVLDAGGQLFADIDVESIDPHSYAWFAQADWSANVPMHVVSAEAIIAAAE